MYRKLADYFEKVKKDVFDLPEDRKRQLQKISGYLQEKHKAGESARLTFICTHNSRRSHLCQIWAAAAAHYFKMERLETFSGGTEATAFNPRAIAAVERAGFKVENPGGDNPHYRIFFDEKVQPLLCYSKVYDEPSNPHIDFAAVMTCSEADRNCPFIPGASLRVSLPYSDPKEADGTPAESQIYDERCRQIATEMVYMISQVKL